ncbi:MAG TPA: lipocalin [Verrucomicrobia bacterium]|nr:lipocalin [Verrucomicrobiota bacterium]
MKRFCLPMLLMASSAILGGCTGIPSGVRVVEGFDVQRYQGTWYEIARLDHRFERGLTHVSATYQPRKGGGIAVENRGYDVQTSRWKSIAGRAALSGKPGEGRLKVSFFRPFYGAYNVIALDREAYTHAMVCGPNRDYLWILARERSLPAGVLESLVLQAGQLGFRTENLILVPQQDPPQQNDIQSTEGVAISVQKPMAEIAPESAE